VDHLRDDSRVAWEIAHPPGPVQELREFILVLSRGEANQFVNQSAKQSIKFNISIYQSTN